MFRKLRIAALLYVLLLVAVTSWTTRARNASWDVPLWAVIYPINGEHSTSVQGYIDNLEDSSFESIEIAIQREAKRWGLDAARPIDLRLAPEVDEVPPAPPRSNNPIAIAWWSLRLRYWAWSHDTYDGPSDIRIFTIYYNPEHHERLAHSLGLQKGLLGVVHAYGEKSYAKRNQVVIAHEILHTLGATDKYDLATNQARVPDGLADPELVPLYPQKKAEIMAGRIAISATESKMPKSLKQTVVGRSTALEIGWLN